MKIKSQHQLQGKKNPEGLLTFRAQCIDVLKCVQHPGGFLYGNLFHYFCIEECFNDLHEKAANQTSNNSPEGPQ